MAEFQGIGQVLQEMMQANPKLMKRMNDVRNSLESNPIEIMTSPSDNCPYRKCDGSGWIWIKDWSKRNAKTITEEMDEWMEKCECHKNLVKQREVNRKLDLSGIPPIFSNATVSSFDINRYTTKKNRDLAEIAKKAAANFVENYPMMKEHGKGLYLYSDIKGSGKTRLASSISNALVKLYGAGIAFIKADDLLLQIRKTFNKDSKVSEAEILQTFCEVPVLIIDDIAVEKDGKFAESRFSRIVDYRMENKLPTIFTSNKKIDGLIEIYKEGRISSRIKKMALEIYMPEESIRDQEAKNENAEFEKILFG